MQYAAPRKFSVFSYPKINLALDILAKDKTGFHKIQTVFQELAEPFDEITLEASDSLEIKCDHPKIPIDKTNTVYKAAFLLQRYAVGRFKNSAPPLGAKIFIKKMIPIMSGLGGGAGNAVAALKGLAKLWGIECCKDESHKNACVLRKIADQIGMDCAFFFYGSTALGEHFGEKITPLPSLPLNLRFEIIETGIEISSHWAYQQINIKRCAQNADKTKKLIKALRDKNAAGILKNLHNDFEDFIFEKRKVLLNKKRELELMRRDAKIILAGSGGALVLAYPT